MNYCCEEAKEVIERKGFEVVESGIYYAILLTNEIDHDGYSFDYCPFCGKKLE